MMTNLPLRERNGWSIVTAGLFSYFEEKRLNILTAFNNLLDNNLELKQNNKTQMHS